MEKIDEEKILIVSDSHIGRNKKNINNLKYAYDYAKANGIKSMIHGGDIIEGERKIQYFSPISKMQLEEYIQLLIRYENIKTYLLYGNHDYNAINKNYVSYSELEKLENVIYLGIGKGYVKLWNDDIIKIYHTCQDYKNECEKENYDFELVGHNHIYAYKEEGSLLLPSIDEGDYCGFVEFDVKQDEYILKYLNFDGNIIDQSLHKK